MTKLLKPSEVAELIGVSVGTIQRWTREMRIPHTKIGRHLRFVRTDIEEWLRFQTRIPEPQQYLREIEQIKDLKKSKGSSY